MAPIWEQVGDAFPTGVIVGKIDCDDKNNKGVCSHYDIKGFPTLKFFKKGTFKNKDAVNYDQGRDFDSITTFLTTNTGIQAKKPKVAPTSVLVLDSLSFDPTLSKSKHVLVEFYAPWCIII